MCSSIDFTLSITLIQHEIVGIWYFLLRFVLIFYYTLVGFLADVISDVGLPARIIGLLTFNGQSLLHTQGGHMYIYQRPQLLPKEETDYTTDIFIGWKIGVKL